MGEVGNLSNNIWSATHPNFMKKKSFKNKEMNFINKVVVSKYI